MSRTVSPPKSTERRVALVAVDSRWQDPNGTFYSFSYGIQTLKAAILAAEDLRDTEVLLLDLQADSAEEYLERLLEFRPTLVGLSTYIWSLEVFARLTQGLRRHLPTAVIVAGGCAARRSVFELGPHQALRDRLDAVVPGEGEAVIAELVREHLKPGWHERVAGLELPARGLWRHSPSAERPELDAYPSPYQVDIAPVGKTGYVETFRGCPIHCAFCQWGEQKSDRVHGAEYIASHLEGLKRANVSNVFFVDAAFNLNPRAFRNLVAAESQVGVLKDQIVHGHIYPTHLEEHHLDFFDTFKQVHASVGIQSFDEAVLAKMSRPFDMQRFQRVLTRMKGRLDVDIELIFGLPGDSPRSFWDTFERAIAYGGTVKVFRCLVLPDALLDRGASMGIDFDPRTFELRSCEGWSEADLAREWPRVVKRAEEFERPILNEDWVGFQVDPTRLIHGPTVEELARRDQVASIERSRPDDALVASVRATLAVSLPSWTLGEVKLDRGGVEFRLETPDGPLVLFATALSEATRYFSALDGLGYSHRGPLGQVPVEAVHRAIELLHTHALELVGEHESLVTGRLPELAQA